MTNLDNFLVLENSSVRDALEKIQLNKYGAVFVADIDGRVVGVVTDGDIRRSLLSKVGLDDSVGLCANRSFISVGLNASREELIKKLDHHIRVLPVLDDDGKVLHVVSRDRIPLKAEGSTFVRSRAPVRVSFGGGGSDTTSYFSGDSNGAVISATITVYAHATLRVRDDDRVSINSIDINQYVEYASVLDYFNFHENDLIQSAIRVVRPNFGFDLFLNSDFPVGSGLGGSAAVTAAVLGVFNQLRRDQWSLYELAELAYESERLHLGVKGGWQDQYASVFGGINFMEFNMTKNMVYPLRVDPAILMELEESLILCDTGLLHESGEIHADQAMQLKEIEVRNLVKSNVDLTYEIRDSLLKGNLRNFAYSLDSAWKLKRQFSSKISSTKIDSIYQKAIENGALGGKLLGAGGGGFFLFYVDSFKKNELVGYLKSIGLSVIPFRFEGVGLQSWTVRNY